MNLGPDEVGGIVTALLFLISAFKSVFDFLSKRMQNKERIEELENKNLILTIQVENLEHDIKLIRTKAQLILAEGKRWRLRALKCEEECNNGP